MSENMDLPEWVWNLLDALSDYEDEHPILYRMTADEDIAYARAGCFGHFLSERNAWPPREVQNLAEFRRNVLREAADR